MKVWIQQLVFVDYRQRIFGLVAKAVGVSDVSFLGGRKARDRGLNVLNAIDIGSKGSVSVSHLKNVFLKSGWCWQGSIVRRVIVGKFDVIVLQGDLTILSNWVVQVVALLRRKRVLLWTHGVYGNEGRLKLWVRMTYLKLSSGILLYGNYSRALLEEYGFDTEKLYVVYNSCSKTALDNVTDKGVVGRIQSLNALFKEGVPSQVLVFVGRLTEVKRLDMLVSAVAHLREKEYDVGLLVVGDGSQADELKAQVRELGIARYVCFYGACYDSGKVAELLSLADLCVSPGNVGLTAMSALESGVPVISHNNFAHQMPEFEAINPGRTGDFFKEGDVEDMTRVIANWLDEGGVSSVVADRCRKMIFDFYNPESQIETIKGAINGLPATDYPRRIVLPR